MFKYLSTLVVPEASDNVKQKEKEISWIKMKMSGHWSKYGISKLQVVINSLCV